MLVKFEGFPFVEGGVTAPKGFLAAGMHAGIRPNKTKKDFGILKAEVLCNAAAVYTQNKVKGAPIYVTRKNLANGKAQGMIVNSGIANTCNADGIEKAEMMAKIGADALGISSNDMIVGSTGVIGQPLPIEPIAKAAPLLTAALSASPQGSNDFAESIMTTDTVKKEVCVEFMLDDKTCRIGGVAKGSGMIHPNMATMLCFLTTDTAISSDLLALALKQVTDDTFNMISVDGDTSTNDTAAILASGLAGNEPIICQDEAYEKFVNALYVVLMNLSRMLARDGEGATKLLECVITGAKSKEQAKIVAKSIICSTLTKAAMFGADANWGRVLCAIGYAETDVDIDKVDVSFASNGGVIAVCQNGAGIPFSEELAKNILLQEEVKILVELHAGSESAHAWGCDLTYDYVKINGDYRT